ncbi:tyrosine-type recombinase/integrase [Nonomuraea maheshkhaliensis]|uniref:tyrosine-type recombinase/integrase n=1 Tax=Nonomuraea maheshkhaliensis TaxID=419590 RepID=UPI0031F79705
MTVYDQWHKSRPEPGEAKCTEHKRVPTAKHGQGARWQVRYRDEKGEQRKRNFERKADADRFDVTRRADEPRGEWIDPKLGQTRFQVYAQTWMASRLHKPGTVTTYAGHLKNHINPMFGLVPLAAIRPTAVQGWVKDLHAKGLAPRTVETIYVIFSSIIRGAVRDAMIRRSPCVDIRLPEADKTTIRLLSPAEVIALYRAMRPEFAPLILLGAAAGLRQGEAFGLAGDRLDFQGAMLRVDRQVVVIDRRPVLAPPKTRASVRDVPMPAVLADALAEHIDRRKPKDALFRTSRGNLIRRDYFNADILKPAILAAKVPADMTFHDLRHTFASTALAEGVPISEVSRWLGHESITTTVDLYGHLVPEASQRARTAMDKVLFQELRSPRSSQP